MTAGVIMKGTKTFIARRAPGQNLAGYWEFPGGKVEGDETLSECLERELLEELGIETESSEILTNVFHENIQLVALRCKIVKGIVVLQVHDQCQWVEIQELTNYLLAPADMDIALYLQGTH